MIADATVSGTVAAEAPIALQAESDRTTMQTTCNPTNDTAVITARWNDASPATAVIRWTTADGDAGEVDMTELGTSEATGTLGPFTDPGTVTWFVTVTDALGAAASTTPQEIAVDPCPG